MGCKLIEFNDFSGKFRDSYYVYDANWPNWKDQIENLDRKSGGVVNTFPQWEGTKNQGGNWSTKIPPIASNNESGTPKHNREKVRGSGEPYETMENGLKETPKHGQEK